MEGGDGLSLARGHSHLGLAQLVTSKWATSEMMFEVGALFVEATELRAFRTASPSAIVTPDAVLSSTTRVNVP